SLIAAARQRYPDLDFIVMDMERLRLEPASFDLVFSSLTLHYVRDWAVVLRNVHRVLKPGGIFLFSTHNPVYWGAEERPEGEYKLRALGYRKHVKSNAVEVYGDYARARKIHDTWFGSFNVTYYHRPFSAILNDILRSKFKLVYCVEPKPLSSAKRIDKGFWEKASKLPLFVIFRLRK
ncbi:MAG: class I SAM-dependent methyltransferase, partial [Candidatus Edwardsbacteria bacterium]|nr:class I SAM-dependent methyltransferase [Candidatus Edwardsbacteria bacterium]